MKTWLITPVVSSEQPYTIEAETYEFDTSTGRHLFKIGDTLVANLVNVSVRQQP